MAIRTDKVEVVDDVFREDNYLRPLVVEEPVHGRIMVRVFPVPAACAARRLDSLA